MRVVSSRDLLAASLPAELRPGSKIALAYTGLRTNILESYYQPDQVLIPREIEKTYNVSNTSVQLILMRLAMEGLVKVLPIRERSNASFNEYRVADLSVRSRMLSDRRGDFVEDDRSRARGNGYSRQRAQDRGPAASGVGSEPR